MNTDHARNMKIILYFMYGLPDVFRQDKYEKLARYLANNYELEELRSFSNTINFVLDDPGYNFKNVDQRLPHKTKDIQFFLMKVKEILDDISTSAPSDS